MKEMCTTNMYLSKRNSNFIFFILLHSPHGYALNLARWVKRLIKYCLGVYTSGCLVNLLDI